MAANDEAERSKRLTVHADAPATSQVVSARTSAETVAVRSNETATRIPSSRPTSVPDYDAVAMAKGVLSFDPRASAARAIPRRVPGADATSLPHAAAFVLMHVDDVSTIAMIAGVADLNLEEVVMYFLELAALGIVTMGERRPAESMPPDSHVHRKIPRE